jgi:hypothetical protein
MVDLLAFMQILPPTMVFSDGAIGCLGEHQRGECGAAATVTAKVLFVIGLRSGLGAMDGRAGNILSV